MNANLIRVVPVAAMAVLLGACAKKASVEVTSAAGAKCAPKEEIKFTKGQTAEGVVVVVNPDEKRQTLVGIGGSLTESSAYVLACLEPEARQEVLKMAFSEDEANYSIVRTQVGASDFSPVGKYSLAEVEGDTALLSFSMQRDMEGFSKEEFPLVKDESYDLYQLMVDVANIKKNQTDTEYRIFANTWTAPAWMKDNNKYYEKDYTVNPPIHRGGRLLPQFYQTYADYLIKFLEAYRSVGIEIYGMSPVNEPMGNDGGWESMDFSGPEEAVFIGQYFGPALKAAGFDQVNIFGFDQNIFEMQPYTAAIYGDELANSYTTGMALHWYGSTVSCFPEVLDSIHALYPDKELLHTEGCVDNFGCPVWGPEIRDPEGFVEPKFIWWKNDAWWWSKEATDWAYSTPWDNGNHPKFAPVQRYASYIIETLNHWVTGHIDWNFVLDKEGGPNHVGNFAASPILVDLESGEVYYTPVYYLFRQFSRALRPGDVVLGVQQAEDPDLMVLATQKPDGSYVVNVFNKSEEEKTFTLRIGEYEALVTLQANALETIRVAL